MPLLRQRPQFGHPVAFGQVGTSSGARSCGLRAAPARVRSHCLHSVLAHLAHSWLISGSFLRCRQGPEPPSWRACGAFGVLLMPPSPLRRLAPASDKCLKNVRKISEMSEIHLLRAQGVPSGLSLTDGSEDALLHEFHEIALKGPSGQAGLQYGILGKGDTALLPGQSDGPGLALLKSHVPQAFVGVRVRDEARLEAARGRDEVRRGEALCAAHLGHAPGASAPFLDQLGVVEDLGEERVARARGVVLALEVLDGEVFG